MMLPLALLILGVVSLWMAIKQWNDVRSSQSDFSEWIVSDASPLNRKLWRANRMVLMIGLWVGAIVCFAVLGSLMLK